MPTPSPVAHETLLADRSHAAASGLTAGITAPQARGNPAFVDYGHCRRPFLLAVPCESPRGALAAPAFVR
jgi:hypothetical protein